MSAAHLITTGLPLRSLLVNIFDLAVCNHSCRPKIHTSFTASNKTLHLAQCFEYGLHLLPMAITGRILAFVSPSSLNVISRVQTEPADGWSRSTIPTP